MLEWGFFFFFLKHVFIFLAKVPDVRCLNTHGLPPLHVAREGPAPRSPAVWGGHPAPLP